MHGTRRMADAVARVRTSLAPGQFVGALVGPYPRMVPAGVGGVQRQSDHAGRLLD